MSQSQDQCPQCGGQCFGLPSCLVCEACGRTSLEDGVSDEVRSVGDESRVAEKHPLHRFHIGSHYPQNK